MKISSAALGLVLCFCLALVPAAHAATYSVTHTDDLGPGSLRQAMLDANASAEADTIGFNLSNCPCTIVLGSTLPRVSGELTIEGPGAGALSISGNNAVRVMVVEAGATLDLRGVTIMRGLSSNGSGIGNIGTLRIRQSTLADNNAPGQGAPGGGIRNLAGAHLEISESQFLRNLGGGITNNGTLTVNTSTFTDNRTGDFGGGGAIANLSRATRNAGPGVAGEVRVTDPIPGDTTFVSAQSSQGSCAAVAGTMQCAVGTLASGGSASITLVVKVRPGLLGLRTITNTASVSAQTFDPNGANNAATAKTTVLTLLTR